MLSLNVSATMDGFWEDDDMARIEVTIEMMANKDVWKKKEFCADSKLIGNRVALEYTSRDSTVKPKKNHHIHPGCKSG